ncbi:MAG TPA: RNA polymerase sporulation sigma factor SigF [Clostridia bacterium]
MDEFSDNKIYELIDRAKNGDKLAQSIMVENNVGLVWSIVKRFQNRGYETEDLFQIGSIGLLKAVKKFDSSFGVKFSTYAVPMIIGEIKRFLRDDGIIKVSRSLKELNGKIRATKEIMIKELGREPSVNELSEHMGIAAEELVMAMEASNAPESLYNTVMEGDSAPVLLIDRIDSEGNGDEPDMIDRIALRQILETLKPREKQIIVLRYFSEKTQAQIAKLLGISQVQVSRIEKKVLQDIRNKITSG